IDLVKIPFRLEKAFGVALGQDLFCVLCETKEDAINALELVKKNTLLSGGIVFLSLKNLPDSNNSSEKKDQKLSNYIEADKKVKLAVDYLTKNVYLIDDKNKISITSDLTSVTTQGEMFSPYKIAYGTLSSQPSNVLARRRELSSLSKEENNLSNEILKFKEKIEKKRLELALILENLTLSQKKLNEMLFKAQILEATLTTYQNEIIKQKESLTLIQEQSNELNKKIMSDKAAKESLLEDENDLKKIVSDNERELQTLKLEIEAIEKEELGFHREIIETETHLKSLKQQEIQLNQQIGKLNQELKEIKTLIESEHKICEGLESIVKRIQPTYELFFVLYEKGNWWATRLANAASGDENFFKEIRDSFKKLQEEKIKLEDRKEKLTEDIRLKELKKVQLEGETTSAVEKIVEEYDTPLEKALEKYPIKISYAVCEKKIGEIKHQLAQLGPINPMAIEEFKELDERQKFLNEQINDLMQSKKALEKVVRVINKKIEERFKETFVEVNNHFQAVFSYLFHGGKAEIILENEDNLLESGIEIQVQPQGKKLQKLSLLSGGETA
ncbi:MAG: hypothetical protein Q8M92_04670, partial [Candidatus Subteraquimicrobiales bacterium]|nr:hypothetical protein [Candidatus Subteraquimicrobiales bacterium]